jgi:hypothetical protein
MDASLVGLLAAARHVTRGHDVAPPAGRPSAPEAETWRGLRRRGAAVFGACERLQAVFAVLLFSRGTPASARSGWVRALCEVSIV